MMAKCAAGNNVLVVRRYGPSALGRAAAVELIAAMPGHWSGMVVDVPAVDTGRCVLWQDVAFHVNLYDQWMGRSKIRRMEAARDGRSEIWNR